MERDPANLEHKGEYEQRPQPEPLPARPAQRKRRTRDGRLENRPRHEVSNSVFRRRAPRTPIRPQRPRTERGADGQESVARRDALPSLRFAGARVSPSGGDRGRQACWTPRSSGRPVVPDCVACLGTGLLVLLTTERPESSRLARGWVGAGPGEGARRGGGGPPCGKRSLRSCRSSLWRGTLEAVGVLRGGYARFGRR